VECRGLFVNAPPADVAALCKSLKLDAAQLHGDETAETVAERAGSVPVVKAFRVDTDFDLKTLDDYPGALPFCLTRRSQANYGGTGRTTDWDAGRASRQPGTVSF